MAASRESLLALCLMVLALPFCASFTSQAHESPSLGRPGLRASTGRHLLQASTTVQPLLLGDADGGLTLGSYTLYNASITQVIDTTKTTWSINLDGGYYYDFADNLAQTGCGVMQVTGTGSFPLTYAAYLNLTYIQPPSRFRTRDSNTAVSVFNSSNYYVGQQVGVNRVPSLTIFPSPYSITPIIANNDTITRFFNVSATFRPVGKACSSATFGNDGQQASPVQVWVVGENVTNPTTGGRLEPVLLANATCMSIKLEVQNAPTVDQLNATVNIKIIAYAKLGVTGPLLNQTTANLQQSFAASSATSSYSGSLNNLDPGTIYVISTSGSGPTKNAVTVTVRVAMLTQKAADCGTQLTKDLSLAQPASTGK